MKGEITPGATVVGDDFDGDVGVVLELVNATARVQVETGARREILCNVNRLLLVERVPVKEG